MLGIPGALDHDVFRIEAEITARAFALFQDRTDKPITVIRGNHDHPSLSQKILQERFRLPGHRYLRFNVIPHLIHQPEPDVVFTHGHILDNVEAMRAIILDLFANGVSPIDSLRRLHTHETEIESSYLQKDRKQERVVHEHMAVLKAIGIDGWLESTAIPWLISIEKNREQLHHELSGGRNGSRAHNGILTHMTDTASYLCAVLGANVISLGHDHVAGLARRIVRIPDSDRTERVIVANSGAYVGTGRPKTAVYIDTDAREPGVEVLAYRNGRIALYRDSKSELQTLTL